MKESLIFHFMNSTGDSHSASTLSYPINECAWITNPKNCLSNNLYSKQNCLALRLEEHLIHRDEFDDRIEKGIYTGNQFGSTSLNPRSWQLPGGKNCGFLLTIKMEDFCKTAMDYEADSFSTASVIEGFQILCGCCSFCFLMVKKRIFCFVRINFCGGFQILSFEQVRKTKFLAHCTCSGLLCSLGLGYLEFLVGLFLSDDFFLLE